ncbi:ribonuclease H [Trifolium pratense]|uniref:Ribonuclease H n=1 Tax=Trifolium pratense TaxID=57577 RepID=A0A2K3M621_TRIPR|nr:ribonuclease H [Trifolium pratense]
MQQPRVVSMLGWKPPLEGWVKLNTDGASKDGRISRCDGIVRDSGGHWLGGFAKYLGACNAFVAELWG